MKFTKLSDAEILFVEMVTQPYLTYFGYELLASIPAKNFE